VKTVLQSTGLVQHLRAYVHHLCADSLSAMGLVVIRDNINASAGSAHSAQEWQQLVHIVCHSIVYLCTRAKRTSCTPVGQHLALWQLLAAALVRWTWLSPGRLFVRGLS
jgi:hypothetical protein